MSTYVLLFCFQLAFEWCQRGHSSNLFSWFILIHLDSSWFILIHLDSSWFILIHLDSSWFYSNSFLFVTFAAQVVRHSSTESSTSCNPWWKPSWKRTRLIKWFLDGGMEIGGEGWRCTDVTYVHLKSLELMVVSWCLIHVYPILISLMRKFEDVWSILKRPASTFQILTRLTMRWSPRRLRS